MIPNELIRAVEYGNHFDYSNAVSEIIRQYTIGEILSASTTADKPSLFINSILGGTSFRHKLPEPMHIHGFANSVGACFGFGETPTGEEWAEWEFIEFPSHNCPSIYSTWAV